MLVLRWAVRGLFTLGVQLCVCYSYTEYVLLITTFIFAWAYSLVIGRGCMRFLSVRYCVCRGQKPDEKEGLLVRSLVRFPMQSDVLTKPPNKDCTVFFIEASGTNYNLDSPKLVNAESSIKSSR